MEKEEIERLQQILRELQIAVIDFIALDDRSRDAKTRARERCFDALQIVRVARERDARDVRSLG